MGIFLMFSIAGGLIAGLLVGMLCGVVALLVVLRNQKTRSAVWPVAAGGLVIGLILAMVAVQFIPQRPVRPGSDYDIAAYNLFISIFGYTLVPAIGLVAGALATCFCPRRGLVLPPPLPAPFPVSLSR